jgi:hypothetical protein
MYRLEYESPPPAAGEKLCRVTHDHTCVLTNGETLRWAITPGLALL